MLNYELLQFLGACCHHDVFLLIIKKRSGDMDEPSLYCFGEFLIVRIIQAQSIFVFL